jgi:hypothetical protein
MRRGKGSAYVFGSLILVAALYSLSGPARRVLAGQVQQPGTSPGLGTQMPSVSSDKTTDPLGSPEAHAHRLQESLAMDERHKKMQSDADKLLQLATDLKLEVDRSTKNETSVSAFLKADQIEKLAHDVKQRLKN